MRGEVGVSGEGRVVGVPKFHYSWGKCTMPIRLDFQRILGCNDHITVLRLKRSSAELPLRAGLIRAW